MTNFGGISAKIRRADDPNNLAQGRNGQVLRPLKGSGALGKIEKGQVLFCPNSAVEEFDPSFQIDVRFEDKREPEMTVGTVPSILHECLAAVRGAVELLTKETTEHGAISRWGS